MKLCPVCDTVQCMYKYMTQPALTLGDVMYKTSHDLIKVLCGKGNTSSDEQRHDLQYLSTIYKDVVTSQPNLAPSQRV